MKLITEAIDNVEYIKEDNGVGGKNYKMVDILTIRN